MFLIPSSQADQVRVVDHVVIVLNKEQAYRTHAWISCWLNQENLEHGGVDLAPMMNQIENQLDYLEAHPMEDR